jgi:hypothetical protein
LIGLGLVFLLNNLEVVSWDVWTVIMRMWPLLLVAIGIDLLFGRRSGVGAAISAVLILVMFAGAFWVFQATGDFWGGDQISQSIVQELGDASQAEVELSMSVGALSLSAMPESSGLLIEGQIQVSEFEDVRENYRITGDTADFSLSTHGQYYHPGWLFSSQADENKGWELYLNPDVPTDLKVDTGVGKTVIDLTGMTLTSLEVDSGVGEVVVTLPEGGDFDVRVSGGVGRLEVRIPAGAAVRVNVDTGLGSFSVVGDFTHRNDAYYTDSYDNADDQIDIFLDGGVGNIQVIEIDS